MEGSEGCPLSSPARHLRSTEDARYPARLGTPGKLGYSCLSGSPSDLDRSKKFPLKEKEGLFTQSGDSRKEGGLQKAHQRQKDRSEKREGQQNGLREETLGWFPVIRAWGVPQQHMGSGTVAGTEGCRAQGHCSPSPWPHRALHG